MARMNKIFKAAVTTAVQRTTDLKAKTTNIPYQYNRQTRLSDEFVKRNSEPQKYPLITEMVKKLFNV